MRTFLRREQPGRRSLFSGSLVSGWLVHHGRHAAPRRRRAGRHGRATRMGAVFAVATTAGLTLTPAASAATQSRANTVSARPADDSPGAAAGLCNSYYAGSGLVSFYNIGVAAIRLLGLVQVATVYLAKDDNTGYVCAVTEKTLLRGIPTPVSVYVENTDNGNRDTNSGLYPDYSLPVYVRTDDVNDCVKWGGTVLIPLLPLLSVDVSTGHCG